jgi:Fe-Mn family superoxide dismutase
MFHPDDYWTAERALETITDWKSREAAQAAAILKAVPEIGPPYERLLQEWEKAFSLTIHHARDRLEESPDAVHPVRSADSPAMIPRLLEDCLAQSREFARHLSWIRQHSEAARIPAVTWSDALAQATSSARVPVGGHHLPPLPYPYNALEPWIDERTMRLHHDKHHQSYVDGLNLAEKKREEARVNADFTLLKHWERELAFHGAGHYLHTLFWESMTPKGGGQPSGELAAEIGRSFGEFESFRALFSEAANKVEGGGWAILVWSPRSRRLEILTAEKHQNLSQWDVVPILPLDVWEHAYYLKYENERPAYVRNWWNVVNWPAVSARFAKARKLEWPPV